LTSEDGKPALVDNIDYENIDYYFSTSPDADGNCGWRCYAVNGCAAGEYFDDSQC